MIRLKPVNSEPYMFHGLRTIGAPEYEVSWEPGRNLPATLDRWAVGSMLNSRWVPDPGRGVVHCFYRGPTDLDDDRNHALGKWTVPISEFYATDTRDFTPVLQDTPLLSPERDITDPDVGGTAPAKLATIYPLLDVDGTTIWLYYKLTFTDGPLTEWRWRSKSVDGGLTWTDHTQCRNASGALAKYGSCAVWQTAADEWHMTYVANDNAFYVTSTDGITWATDTQVQWLTKADAVSGEWRETHIVGMGVHVEDDYTYCMVTGGYGYDDDPPVTPHYDSTTTAALFRAPNTDLTAWEEYPLNPVYQRGAIKGTTGLGIWNLTMVAADGRIAVAHEAIGAVFDGCNEKQFQTIRNSQYAGVESYVRIAHTTDYQIDTGTFVIRVNHYDAFPAMIMSKCGQYYLQEGDFWVWVDDKRRFHLEMFKDGRIQRFTTPQQSDVLSISTLVLAFDPTDTRLYWGINDDPDIPILIAPPMDLTTNTRIILLGRGQMFMPGNLWGQFDRFAINPTKQNWTEGQNSGAAAALGNWRFNGATDTEAKADSGLAGVNVPNNAEFYGGVTWGENSGGRIGLPGGGGFYDRQIGSQQHLAEFPYPTFTEMWSAPDPYPAGTYLVRHVATGMLLAVEGGTVTLTTDPANAQWTVDKANGFTRFANGANYLTYTDRVYDSRPMTGALANMPQMTFDPSKQWMMETGRHRGVRLINRDNSHVLRYDNPDLAVGERRDSVSELWVLEAP